MKRALITGITGQDGSYLCELLLEKGYEVHGLVRRASYSNYQRIDHLINNPELKNRIILHQGDLSDTVSIENLFRLIEPEEVYHLAAQSNVGESFKTPEYTADVTGIGTLRMLESIRKNNFNNRIRFYQASTSELFGNSPGPQNENTEMKPRSPYGCAKLYAYHTALNYRDGYGIFASNGILFNHESPRRGETFVTKKITKTLSKIFKGIEKNLYLGNLDARRDWGYAPDYVDAMYKIIQHSKPDDFVVATGETHTIKEFLYESFSLLKLDWKNYVKIDPAYVRPTEVNHLVGDYSKIRNTLGWEPKVKFKELIKIMVESDLNE